MPFTEEQKIFCVMKKLEKKSYKYAIQQFRVKYNRNHTPDKSMIFRWIKKFEAAGTIHDMRKKSLATPVGRKPTVRSPENIAAVQVSVGRSPKKSLRKRSQELGLKKSSVQRILIKDLHLYPYRIQIKQKLTPADKEKRVEMCNWFTETIEDNPDFLEDVWFSDEAHFNLSGHVNIKNNVFWGSEPPNEVLQRPLHSIKCTAWAAISKHGIIGPFFFEDAQGNTETVNKERYLVVLNKFWRELGVRSRRRGQNRVDRGVQWFQQDGAPPHTANVTLAWLDQKFPDRLVSRRRDPEWAPHSPDLSPPDLYLWGYMKDRV